jgi:hypothetical protein
MAAFNFCHLSPLVVDVPLEFHPHQLLLPHHELALAAAACLCWYACHACSAGCFSLSALAFQNSSNTAFCAALLLLYLK